MMTPEIAAAVMAERNAILEELEEMAQAFADKASTVFALDVAACALWEMADKVRARPDPAEARP